MARANSLHMREAVKGIQIAHGNRLLRDVQIATIIRISASFDPSAVRMDTTQSARAVARPTS
jgi:hypothetical protein